MGRGGVPRELCRGLYCIVTYLLCTFPLDDIVRAHGLAYHFYADDSQLYCSFKLQDQATSVRAIESCLNDIDAWLLANTLKLNKKKKKKELLAIEPIFAQLANISKSRVVIEIYYRCNV